MRAANGICLFCLDSDMITIRLSFVVALIRANTGSAHRRRVYLVIQGGVWICESADWGDGEKSQHQYNCSRPCDGEGRLGTRVPRRRFYGSLRGSAKREAIVKEQ